MNEKKYVSNTRSAGLLIRIVAFFIDGMFIGTFTKLFGLVHPMLSFAVSLLYFSFMEASKWQGTLGKQICGLIVVDNKTGERIKLNRAVFRHFMKIIGIMFFGLGYVTLLIGRPEEKISVVDMICGTNVIKGRIDTTKKKENK